MKTFLIKFAMQKPKLVIALIILFTLLTGMLVGNRIITNPSGIIDTDAENMLDKKEHVRVFHKMTKDKFALFDMVAMGIYHPGENGVFTPEILQAVNDITNEILALKDNSYVIDAKGDTFFVDLSSEFEVLDDNNETETVIRHGIIFEDMMALNQIEDINGETGELVIKTLMSEAPTTHEGAMDIKRRIDLNPLLNNKIASTDGKVVGIYVPVNSKKISYDLSQVMNILAEKYLTDIQVDGMPFFGTEEAQQGEYIVAGIPVAQDTFGKYMFEQMGVSAPLAGLVIFILLFVFFRRVKVIIAPMVLAILAISWTMALLIGAGYTVHIMSSMIPIFLFPIAVLNSIHVISSIHKRYAEGAGLEATILMTYESLFVPILFTSITTVVGFVSLILTFIPPVQIFGIFVAIGVALSWLLSVTFLPAYLVLVGEKTFEDFGHAEDSEHHLLGKIGRVLQKISQNYSKSVIVVTVILFIVSVIGISQIEINDNPVKWFKPGHPLRHADELMNEHVSGTYMANIVFTFTSQAPELTEGAITFAELMQLAEKNEINTAFYHRPDGLIWGELVNGTEYLAMIEASEELSDTFMGDFQKELQKQKITLVRRAASDAIFETYDEIEYADLSEILQDSNMRRLYFDAENQILFGQDKQNDISWYVEISEDVVMAIMFNEALANLKQRPIKLADAHEPFKSPELLNYMQIVEKATLGDTTTVGSIASILDILRKVSWELRNRDDEYFRLPLTKSETGQYIFLAKGGESPDDLHKFITRDYDAAHLWLQLSTGDNKAMEEVVARVNNFIAENEPPLGIEIDWAGLNYINTVWQQKMVGGMANSLIGAYITVFLMVTMLFRSLRWGLIAMIPITLTIALIYAMIGFFGKPYDMPIAVLSSLTLGLSIDFGIHYIERSRLLHKSTRDFKTTIGLVFGEPATAMLQNTIAIAIGFVPLFFADLVPYLTVGAFFFAIMLISGFSTLIILPAISNLLQNKLYPVE
ncbi:MAG: hypothetical protein DWQ05_11750 [Calditrichaeota bacterium]|nr:MAG: hypothetical protein DWQ05_11750 [Calditrichota bacterium]